MSSQSQSVQAVQPLAIDSSMSPSRQLRKARLDIIKERSELRALISKANKFDKARAERINFAFEAMKHSPSDTKARELYFSLVQETYEQYQSFIETGNAIVMNNQQPRKLSSRTICLTPFLSKRK